MTTLEAAASLETVPCGICGSDEFTVVLPSRRDPGAPVDLEKVFRSSADEPLMDQMVQCSGCGLKYVRPRLRSDLVLEGYGGGADEGFVSQVAFRERTFTRCLDRVEAAARPPVKRVLDVGTAGGSFLSVARRRGYETLGCEPSAWLCRFAKDHYGLDVHTGTLFDVPVAKESLGLLTLWDVLEHTTDPLAVLKRAHELLAPGGILALTYPDYGSGAARLLGSKWPFLLTVHLYYFDPGTMRELLKRAGFAPVRFRPHIQTLEMGYVAKRAAPYLGALAGLLTRAVRALRCESLPFHYWVGQTLVVARKV